VAKFDGAGLADPTPQDIESLRYQKYQLPEPPAQSSPSIPEPSRKLKGLDQSKISSRPPARLWSTSPDIDAHGHGHGRESRGRDDDSHDAPPSSAAPLQRHAFEDPI